MNDDCIPKYTWILNTPNTSMSVLTLTPEVMLDDWLLWWLTCKTKSLHLHIFSFSLTNSLMSVCFSTNMTFLSLWNLSFYSLRIGLFPFAQEWRCGINIEVVYVVAKYFLSLTNAFEMQGISVDDDVAFAPFQKENISFACAKWGEKS